MFREKAEFTSNQICDAEFKIVVSYSGSWVFKFRLCRHGLITIFEVLTAVLLRMCSSRQWMVSKFSKKIVPSSWGSTSSSIFISVINPLALQLDIYSLAHHLCKMWIFYEPRGVTLGNTRHFVSATYRCDDTRGCVMQFWPPGDERMCSKNVEAWNKLIVKQKFCVSSWLITEINILRCTVSKTSKIQVW